MRTKSSNLFCGVWFRDETMV